jgi:protein TonB
MIQDKPTNPSNSPIEITDYKEYSKILPDSKVRLPRVKTPESQIAESEETQNRKLDPNAKYLGKQNQTVEKETRADRIDDFREKKGTGAKGIPTTVEAIPPTATDFGRDEALSEEGEIPDAPSKTQLGVKRNWKTLSLKDLSVGGDGGATAATDDKLNLDRGERTLLSTREYKFFGYYQRIKDLLRQYWKPNIEHQMARLWGKGKQVKEDELVTRVLVLLDENGKLTKISKLASSGYIELDEAAVEAFQAAAPFPNPPKAMLDEDGFVRINWDFILTTDNSPRIQFRNVGSVPPPY